MVVEPRWVAERLWFVKTKTLPRPFAEYPTSVLYALLIGWDDAMDITYGRTPDHAAGRPSIAPLPKWDEPMLTGDPVTDKWERAIVAGEDIDLSMPHPIRRVVARV
ncbi:MAG: hypothetical protein CMB99_01370 [Flavobacteriaceae bacterium]|nr:hypothetical protein [Flavobacteriaceae bacterium]|tara:strand:- start:245 stop:562 length:318 start_codon:yes stop_codon:yes gene_type:complete